MKPRIYCTKICIRYKNIPKLQPFIANRRFRRPRRLVPTNHNAKNTIRAGNAALDQRPRWTRPSSWPSILRDSLRDVAKLDKKRSEEVGQIWSQARAGGALSQKNPRVIALTENSVAQAAFRVSE